MSMENQLRTAQQELTELIGRCQTPYTIVRAHAMHPDFSVFGVVHGKHQRGGGVLGGGSGDARHESPAEGITTAGGAGVYVTVARVSGASFASLRRERAQRPLSHCEDCRDVAGMVLVSQYGTTL